MPMAALSRAARRSLPQPVRGAFPQLFSWLHPSCVLLLLFFTFRPISFRKRGESL